MLNTRFEYVYIIGLYAFVSLSLGIFYMLWKRKKRFFAALFVLTAAIAGDQFLYGYANLKYRLISPVEKKDANTMISQYAFQEYRKREIIMDTWLFRSFRSALEEVPTAFDASGSFPYFDPRSNKAMKANVNDILYELRIGTFPLFEEATTMKFIDLIRHGSTAYDSWDKKKRCAYLNILQCAIGIIDERTIHALVWDINKYFLALSSHNGQILLLLKSGIKDGYNSLASDNTPWRTKNVTESLVIQLILQANSRRGPSNSTAEILNATVNYYAFLYMAQTPAQIIDHIYKQNFSLNANTFVRFKDYDMLVNLFETDSYGIPEINMRKKILQDMGISEPIIRFFNKTQLINPGEYFSYLESGDIKKDIIYIEAANRINNAGLLTHESARRPQFSYTIEEYNPNLLRLSYKVNQAGCLYLSDCYDKYWKARIDGKITAVHKANGAFKAIALPEGSHRVEFIYDPLFFRVTMYLYYATIFLCLSFLLYTPFYKRKW
jgi:hypothetical protein